MFSRNYFPVFSLLALALTSISAVSAYPLSIVDKEKKDPVLIYREAGASSEQEAKIRQMAQEFEKSARVRLERIRNLSKQIKDLSYIPEPDEVKILGIQEEMNQLQNNLNLERIKLMFQIRQLLSLEQKQKLVQLMSERAEGSSLKAQ